VLRDALIRPLRGLARRSTRIFAGFAALALVVGLGISGTLGLASPAAAAPAVHHPVSSVTSSADRPAPPGRPSHATAPAAAALVEEPAALAVAAAAPVPAAGAAAAEHGVVVAEHGVVVAEHGVVVAEHAAVDAGPATVAALPDPARAARPAAAPTRPHATPYPRQTAPRAPPFDADNAAH